MCILVHLHDIIFVCRIAVLVAQNHEFEKIFKLNHRLLQKHVFVISSIYEKFPFAAIQNLRKD